MADIFISYAHEDRELAAALAGKLSSRGYTVWWDPELVGGSEFREVIREQLLQSQYSIVIWSPHSVKSKWVIDEAEEARGLGKLIPVRTTLITDSHLPLGLRGLQTLRLDDMDGILRAIRSLMIKKGAFGERGVLESSKLLLTKVSALSNRYSYEYGLHIAICFIVLPVIMSLLALLPEWAFRNPFKPFFKPFDHFTIWHALAVFFPALGWANLVSRMIGRQHDHGIFLFLIITSLALFLLYLFMPTSGDFQWYTEYYFNALLVFLSGGALTWLYFFFRTLRSAIRGS